METRGANEWRRRLRVVAPALGQQASSWLADEERGRLREKAGGGKVRGVKCEFFFLEDKKMKL